MLAGLDFPSIHVSRFTLSLVSWLFIGFSSIQGADGNGYASAAGSSHRPWVWEIDGPHARIWLAGCLHLGASRDRSAFPAYLPYYRAAAVVYFETQPGTWNSYEVKHLLDRRGFLPDRQSLSNRISKDTWQQMQTALASNPGKLQRLSTMEPWLAAFNLTQDAYARAGLSAEDSLQGFIEHLAARDSKPIGALESPKDQILAMADASLSDQEAFLQDTVRNLDRIGPQTQQLRNAWLSGDQTALQSVLGLNSTPERSGMHQNLIGVRNSRWLRKIREIEKGGKDSIVVVGVEHLISTPYALPDLLTQAGLPAHRVTAHSRDN